MPTSQEGSGAAPSFPWVRARAGLVSPAHRRGKEHWGLEGAGDSSGPPWSSGAKCSSAAAAGTGREMPRLTQQPGQVVGLLLLDGLIVQRLKEDVQHQEVLSAEPETQGSVQAWAQHAPARLLHTASRAWHPPASPGLASPPTLALRPGPPLPPAPLSPAMPNSTGPSLDIVRDHQSCSAGGWGALGA